MTTRLVRAGERIPVAVKPHGVVMREATEDGVLFSDGEAVWFVTRKDARKLLRQLEAK